MQEDINKIPEYLAGKQPFEAPAGYFDSFPNRLGYRIDDKRISKRNFDFEFLFRPVAITSVVLSMLVAGLITFRNFDASDAALQQPGETLLSYVEQEGILEEMSEDELFEHLLEGSVDLPENAEDSLSNAIAEELADDDFIDFELHYEL